MIKVVKKDGTRENFNVQKVVVAVNKSYKKPNSEHYHVLNNKKHTLTALNFLDTIAAKYGAIVY